MKEMYLEVSQESGKLFIQRNIQGSFTMLNLLKFKNIADYSSHPDLSPKHPISGEEAYQLYIDSTIPFLDRAGSIIKFQGKGGPFAIGPLDEQWDLVLLVQHQSVKEFLAFAQNQDYLKIAGHRSAALLDSRLLPIE